MNLYLHRRSRRLKKKKEATGVERVSEYLYIILVRLSPSESETCFPNHVNKLSCAPGISLSCDSYHTLSVAMLNVVFGSFFLHFCRFLRH